MTAHERWHATLVYFGLRDDPKLAENWDAGPTRGLRRVALLMAALVGLAMAVGVLAVAGVHVTWATLLRGVVLLAVTISFGEAFGRFRGRANGR